MSLENLRSRINTLDEQILALIAERFSVCAQVGEYKKKQALPVMDPSRVRTVMETRAIYGKTLGLEPDFVRNLYDAIVGEACRLEEKITERPALASPLLRNVVILGGGAVGTLFAQALAQAGCAVTVIDKRLPRLAGVTPLQADAAHPSAEAANALGAADLVVLALPEDAALSAFDAVAPLIKPQALLADTLSVKTPFAAHAQKGEWKFEQVGLNPMFAPALGFKRQAVVAVPLRDGPRGAELLALVEQWGAHVERMSAAEHDQATAALQTLTHATLLSFGNALHHLGYDAQKLMKIAPPPHRLMMGLLARITGGEPHVYWDIQAEHPNAAQVYSAYQESLKELQRIVTTKDHEGFNTLFARAGNVPGTEKENLRGQVQWLLENEQRSVRER